MALFRGDKTLFKEIIVALVVITVVFWILTFFIARQFLKNAMWSEFSASTSRTMSGIARQSINDIKYSDYFQIQRTLQGFYDPNYMNYITVYAADGKLLAMFPRQIDGEMYMFMEKEVLANVEKPATQEFVKINGAQVFHFQQQIKDEDGGVLGFIAIGGTTKQLAGVLKTQTVFFTILGFVVLIVQIAAMGYASRVLTRPLNELTQMLKKNEEIEPEKFLPTFMHQSMPKGASSEVNLFYSVYQKLLQNIHAHIMHSQETAVQASIGKISSHVAHDLRSPISVLKGFVESVSSENDPDTEEYKESALRSIDKMNQMANDLVDYAKAKQVQPSPVALCSLIKDCAHEFDEALKAKGATIDVKCPENLIAQIDGHKMNRVMTNMIQNAMHALLKQGGKIKVTAAMTERGWLSISVEDNGSGIEDKYLKRIFDSTFTLGKPSGTGLGLSYCKNVVEGHGGRISVESTLGKGSRFIVELPMSAERFSGKPEEWAQAGANLPEPAKSARSILVIDDDPEMLIQWKKLLKDITDFEVVTVSGPEEMLKLDPKPEVFRAAISDYRFEGEDITGLDLIEILKERGICCRYLCTGFYYDPTLREEAIAAGAHAIIPKPIPEGLVRQLLG